MQQRCNGLAFGLEVPAKPAFNVAVPLSMTTGWLRSNELPEASPVVSSDAIFFLFIFYTMIMVEYFCKHYSVSGQRLRGCCIEISFDQRIAA